ncbi:MAG: hypothetical protein AAGK04_10110 [Planctomycetota bacterium]
MHALTKVFVVFAAILSVILAGLAIPYAVNAERIASANEQLRTQITALEAARAQAAAAEDEEIGRLKLESQAVANENQQLESDKTRLEREVAQLQRDRRQAEASRDAVGGQVDQLNETLQTQATLLSNANSELTDLRDNELRFRREKLDLEDRISDLESQNEVLTQTVQALQEQLAEVRTAVATGDSRGEAGGVFSESGEPFVAVGAPIIGTVQQVQVDPSTGRTMARVSLGSNDRIQRNQKLFLARGTDRFIGNLVVDEVDLNWAVGEVDTLGMGDRVQPGDTVLTTLQ